jgi:hypothetical protein
MPSYGPHTRPLLACRYSAAIAAGEPASAVTHEFKTLVKECHKRGIEVILDVVFNHTAEGNEQGLTLSFRCVLVCVLGLCIWVLYLHRGIGCVYVGIVSTSWYWVCICGYCIYIVVMGVCMWVLYLHHGIGFVYVGIVFTLWYATTQQGPSSVFIAHVCVCVRAWSRTCPYHDVEPAFFPVFKCVCVCVCLWLLVN